MERPNAWLSYSEADMNQLEDVAKKYRHFLNVGKTERECITQIVKEAEEAGYVSLEEKVKKGEALKAGDKVYTVGMKKIIALYHIGEDDLAEGMNILCAHIDSPRLDIKQNPLYEDTDLAYLDTHYYGGVKKYQWVALPMAMHGVIVKKDGTVVNVTIGEDEEDPVLYITDLLIHLAGQQMAKKASEVVEGEKLDILIGSRPLADLPDDKKKEAVKELIVSENYKIDVNTAMPMRGRSIPLTSLYSLEIRNDSVISYLPYYGRAYSIPYGGGNGLNFKAPLKEYNMKLDKKGNSVITFTARNPEDKFDFRVKVYSNGSTSIDVNMQNRQSISFQGELDVKEE